MSDSLPTVVPNPWISGLLDALARPQVNPLAGLEAPARPTPAELERFAIEDDLAREEDDDAARRGVPGAGGDVMGRAAPRVMLHPSDLPPDPLATVRNGGAVVRTGRRYLGQDFAQPRPVNAVAPAMPLPKGVPAPELVSGLAWRRSTLPREGWTCMGLRLSDGVEGCGYCARGLRPRSRLAVIAHHAHDLTLSACLDCGDSLCGRPVADRNEDEQPIPLALPPLAHHMQDPSLWKGDLATGRMSLDLSEDFQVRLIETKQGIRAEIDFPDMAGETTVVGTYNNHGGAMAAAYFEIVDWEKR